MKSYSHQFPTLWGLAWFFLGTLKNCTNTLARLALLFGVTLSSWPWRLGQTLLTQSLKLQAHCGECILSCLGNGFGTALTKQNLYEGWAKTHEGFTYLRSTRHIHSQDKRERRYSNFHFGERVAKDPRKTCEGTLSITQYMSESPIWRNLTLIMGGRQEAFKVRKRIVKGSSWQPNPQYTEFIFTCCSLLETWATSHAVGTDWQRRCSFVSPACHLWIWWLVSLRRSAWVAT